MRWECRWVSRYARWLVVVVLASLVLRMDAAFEPGHPAQLPQVSKWIGDDPFAGMTDEKRSPVVLLFWSSSVVGSRPALRFISSQKGMFKKEGVRFAAITKDSEKTATEFLAKTGDVSLSVGVDEGGKSFKAFMGTRSGLPYAFVLDKDGKVAWCGRVTELARVVPLVLAGAFDYEKQRAIDDLRRDLEVAAQYMDAAKEGGAADKILAIDPTDRVALETKTRILTRNGDLDGALALLAAAREKAVDSQYIRNALYFIELGVLIPELSMKAKTRLGAMTGEYLVRFKDDSAALGAFAIAIVNGASLEIMPVEGVLRLAKRAVEVAEAEGDKPGLADCLRTLSRSYHLAGCLEKAMAAQEKACSIIGTEQAPVPVSMSLLAEFYKDALAAKSAEPKTGAVALPEPPR